MNFDVTYGLLTLLCSCSYAAETLLGKQALMEKMMNSTVDPCKDFFEYAAGQADEAYVPTTMYDDIRSLLMDLSLSYQIESIQKIRKIYTDCLAKPQYEDPTPIETWVLKAVNKFPDIQFPIDEKDPVMTNFTAYIGLASRLYGALFERDSVLYDKLPKQIRERYIVFKIPFYLINPDTVTKIWTLYCKLSTGCDASTIKGFGQEVYDYRSILGEHTQEFVSNAFGVPVDTTNFTVMMPDILIESPDLIYRRAQLVNALFQNLMHRRTYKYRSCEQFMDETYPLYIQKPLLKFNGDHGGSYLQFPWLKTDDAQHSRLTNGNFFTWGYFEYPKYDSAWSPVMHFSSIAFVMAHELGHNFELLNVTNPEHEATMGCIIHFYSKQCDPKRPRCLMSAKTYFEDFPDQLGIRWAYSAYRRYSLSRPLEPRPRGRNLDKFSDDQLFFLNLAQNMASFPGWDDYSFNNNHSPNTVRVWGSMANFPAFGSAFSCPVGSNYNPRLKCPIFNMPAKPDFDLSSRNISFT